MEAKTRTTTVDMLRDELEHSVEADNFIDRLWDLWEVIDMLVETFGVERAHAIIHVPSFISSPIREVIQV
jgi:hypothetical protein